MAIFEHDREDLMREATALVRRIAFQIENLPVESVVGFKRTGEASFYIQPDRVLQFGLDYQIRRAHWLGQRFSAETIGAKSEQLVEIKRPTRGGQVRLERTELDKEAAELLKKEWFDAIAKFRDQLELTSTLTISALPDVTSVRSDLRDWFERFDKAHLAGHKSTGTGR